MIDFKLVVCAYNAMPWIERCLASIESQNHPLYDVCIIDDASTQEGQRELIKSYSERCGWHALYNKKNRGTLANMIDGVKKMSPRDEDVIVVVDGDDWLANEWVLTKLDRIYREENPLLTYGQHLRYREGTLGCPRPLKPRTLRKRSYRKKGWVFSHLRSFKYGLWKNIRDEDLRGPDGDYFSVTSDLATMFPMAEMAGKRIRYIDEVLYIYNDVNPIGDENAKRADQLAMNRYIRSLPKYQVLKS